MAVSEIEHDAETDVDEPKKKRKKVLQKYRPGYKIKYFVIRKFFVGNSTPTVLYADAISVLVMEGLATWRNM